MTTSKIDKAFESVFSLYRLGQGISLWAMCILVFYQVIMREVFGVGIPWVYELSCFFQITMVWLGVPILLYRNDNIRITAIYTKLPEFFQKFLNVLYYIIYIVCFAMICYGYYEYIKSLATVSSAVLHIPNYVFYGSFVFGISISVLVLIFKAKSIITMQRYDQDVAGNMEVD